MGHKNRFEVLHYLNLVKPASKDDLLAIVQFCRENGFKINYEAEGEKPLPAITLIDFKNWYFSYQPKRNDVVYLENLKMTGIVQSLNLNSITIGVSFDEKKQFIDVPMDYSTNSIRRANFEEMQALQRAIFKHGYSWNYRSAVLKEIHIPENNQWVRLSVLGKRFGLGVFNEIRDNKIYVYLILWEDGKLCYKMTGAIGEVDEVQVEHATMKERDLLSFSLTKEQVSWNGHSKRIEPLELRAELGEVYYYLDDSWTLREATDTYKALHNKRFNCGNYFRIKYFAEEVLKCFGEKRKIQFIETDQTIYNVLRHLKK